MKCSKPSIFCRFFGHGADGATGIRRLALLHGGQGPHLSLRRVPAPEGGTSSDGVGEEPTSSMGVSSSSWGYPQQLDGFS